MINKKKKVTAITVIILIPLLVGLAFLLLSGGNLGLIKSIFTEDMTRDEIRDTLADLGVRGYITIALLSMLQVIVTIMPAEPVQVLAGVTFGFNVGLLCCTVGVVLGNTLIYILYKLLGDGIRQYFVKNLHVSLDRVAGSKKLMIVILILYYLPAIPYGMICFFAASMGMKYPRYILTTLLGAIPSICIGVGLGHIAIAESWKISLAVFLLIVAMLVIVTVKRDAIFAKVNEYIDKPPHSSKTTVSFYPARDLIPPYIIASTILFFRGVRARYINRVGKRIETPSIVLCNHGAFIDFVYAGTILRHQSPNFIVARLYFYHKWFSKLLRHYGCFPKSMFAMDLESAKNCLRVLKNGKILAMMPEARLSTAGKFEDIQPGTYAFLKKSGVPIYTIKMSGDYFASPKWGNGLRRGARVDCELDILFTAEEVEKLSVEEIEVRVKERLYYDEFEWIKTRPEIRYKRRGLAEGLENILTICPKCKGKYTISTKNSEIHCDKCGKLAELDDRYSFVNSEPFENFSLWYEWQKGEMRREIECDESYSLTSPVELKMHSEDGRTMLRTAGNGVATLDRTGLTYRGTIDGEEVEKVFPMKEIYRLLFGAGEDFEIYVGRDIYYFVPEEKRSCVDYYIASEILKDLETKSDLKDENV